MSTPELLPEEENLLRKIRSSDSDSERFELLFMHVVSWQKGERSQINELFGAYSKPIYGILDVTTKRLDKIEDAQLAANESMTRIATQIEYMVKCVDNAITDDKESKKHYQQQYKDMINKITEVEKDAGDKISAIERVVDEKIGALTVDLATVSTAAETRWKILGAGIIVVGGVVAKMFFDGV